MNRLATQTDVDNYAAWCAANIDGDPVTIGDVIYDTYTNVGTKIVAENGGIPASGARDSATIWILSDSFDDDISSLTYQNGGVAPFVTTSENPCHVRILNGRCKFNRRNDESQNVCIEIQDIEWCIIDLEQRTDYPGLRHGITTPYIWNQFGGWLTDLELNRNVRMCSITGANLKGAGFRGVCVFHGFAGFRAGRSNDNQELDWFIMERCASLFGLGERAYIFQTTDNAANPIARQVIMKDNIFAYAGNEGFQVQNMSSKGGESYIKNWVAFANALMWKFAFQNNQDTGTQFEVQDADNGFFIGNGIVEGWGSYGLQLFSSDKSARGYTAGSGTLKIGNIVLTGGRQTGLRRHGSMQYGPVAEWRDIYIKNINDTANELSVESNVDYMMESADETVANHMVNIQYESGKSEFFATSGASQAFDSTFATGVVINDTLPAIQYINNGFDGIDVEKFEVWNDVATQDNVTGSITAFADAGGGLVTVTSNGHGLSNGDTVDITGTTNYNGTFVISNVTTNTFDITDTWVANDATGTWERQVPVTYNAGDIVINAVTDGQYTFYLVNNTHTVAIGTSNRPDNDAVNYTQLTWDESGVRSNEPGWNSGDSQSQYPPCDFRLVQDSFWAKKGVGLSFNPQRTDRTIYQWEYSLDRSSWNEIAGAQSYNLAVSEYNFLQSGMYVRCKRNNKYSLSQQIP